MQYFWNAATGGDEILIWNYMRHRTDTTELF